MRNCAGVRVRHGSALSLRGDGYIPGCGVGTGLGTGIAPYPLHNGEGSRWWLHAFAVVGAFLNIMLRSGCLSQAEDPCHCAGLLKICSLFEWCHWRDSTSALSVPFLTARPTAKFMRTLDSYFVDFQRRSPDFSHLVEVTAFLLVSFLEDCGPEILYVITMHTRVHSA